MVARSLTREPARLPPAIRRPRSGNAAEDRARAEEAGPVEALLQSPLAGARRVGEITIPSGQTRKIPHGLGKVPQDWFLTSPKNAVHIVEISKDRDVLELSAPGAGQAATLWVIP